MTIYLQYILRVCVKRMHLIQRIGAGIVPDVLDVNLLDEIIQVTFHTDISGYFALQCR